MIYTASAEVYSADEIARAAGVPEESVIAAVIGTFGRADAFVPFVQAVRIGHAVTRAASTASAETPREIFTGFASGGPVRLERLERSTGVPLLLSSTLHMTMLAVLVVIATLGPTPTAATLPVDDHAAEHMRFVFMATPGPGGGGGGGGLLQKAPPPKALREGHHKMSSPIPVRKPPKPVIVPTPAPPEPKPEPLKAEQLPIVVAPIVAVPADHRNRIGVLEQVTAQNDSHGAGRGGGVGTGTGTGVGQGDGSGVGPGSGGGTGGGPYRPGSGIEPPRLLREVKADYTEDARQRGVEGAVVLEIVVRRDGSVGDVRMLQGLAAGLNDRAVQAVRQWRFAPAQRQGTPVDVIVEVAVEFRLR
jgi:TonB family protein